MHKTNPDTQAAILELLIDLPQPLANTYLRKSNPDTWAAILELLIDLPLSKMILLKGR